MNETKHIKGRCMCGAVTVEATMSEPALRACHCDMCRRHTSSMFMSLRTDAGSTKVAGPAKSYRSSDWAERGFCEVCGSTLWYGTVHDGVRNLAAGLFDDAAGAEMMIEFFADAAPVGYALAGGHKKLTTQETIALFAPDEDDADA
ncbi:MAG: hypothetical protein ACI9PY_002678 [Ascidiaceihabitans sp.]|jgi:hypothetical protein